MEEKTIILQTIYLGNTVSMVWLESFDYPIEYYEKSSNWKVIRL